MMQFWATLPSCETFCLESNRWALGGARGLCFKESNSSNGVPLFCGSFLPFHHCLGCTRAAGAVGYSGWQNCSAFLGHLRGWRAVCWAGTRALGMSEGCEVCQSRSWSALQGERKQNLGQWATAASLDTAVLWHSDTPLLFSQFCNAWTLCARSSVQPVNGKMLKMFNL